VALAAFIASLVQSPALVMFVCIAVYGALAFAGTFMAGFGPALFTTYTSWYRMWLGERLPPQSLLAAMGLLFSTCVIFYGLGFLVFDQKDI
jgi:ABC-2 type transport system permease protein